MLLVIHSGTSGYGTGGRTPICAGVEAFTEVDEHYFLHFDDPAAEVFLHSRSEHGVQPAGWMRRIGRGRVCVVTPGHNRAVWLQPGFQRLLKNALAWTCGTSPPLAGD